MKETTVKFYEKSLKTEMPDIEEPAVLTYDHDELAAITVFTGCCPSNP